MSDRYAIPKSISKTAFDSLHAKLSAIDGGWLGSNSSFLLDKYKQILEKIHDGIEGPQFKRRRQTPLVNAGYAARMAVMTFILEKWFDSVLSRQVYNEVINVVVLGCGLDALGLWSRYVLNDTLNKYLQDQTPKLNVYEVDAWDNCVLKQRALERSGIVQVRRTTTKTDDDSVKESSFSVLMEGTINTAAAQDDDLSDYHLIAMDLRHICKDKYLLKKALDSTGSIHPSQPTIILSELVLAYIGYESTNTILQSMAKDLLRDNECSMFLCLEPMLPTRTEQHLDSTNEKQLLSVKESYARDYANQFLGKLNRGNSSSCSDDDDDDVFHPLGSNRELIVARLVSCGFSMSSIDAASLRKAVANVSRSRRLIAKEPFDEHAALALNLECYAVVCAFGGSSDGDIGRLLPWLDDSICSSSTIRIVPIEDYSQDILVGNLYSRIYEHLYNEYPAIRKMVKSALKTDLLTDSTSEISAIQNRFQAKRGLFWIALHVKSSDIVGCIGVRQRNVTEFDVEYEVQRLAVDDEHRGKGIGKLLLNAVYEFTLQQGSLLKNDMEMVGKSRNGLSVKLLAVTPDVLVNANNLYSSFGFVKRESFEGGLTMNVYHKTCYIYKSG